MMNKGLVYWFYKNILRLPVYGCKVDFCSFETFNFSEWMSHYPTWHLWNAERIDWERDLEKDSNGNWKEME